jgi:hypothetical protein
MSTRKIRRAKKSCEDFEDLLAQIELILRDPYNFTYELINNLKNEVQLKGEKAIFKINENMNRTISKLDEYNIECKNSFKESEYLGKAKILRLDGSKRVGKVDGHIG